MKKLLYIGNQLSEHGINKTSIETLGDFLMQENYRVIRTSSKKNQLLRLLDMIVTTFVNSKKVDYILIDTYSTSSFWYALICSQIARLFRKKYIPILHGGLLPNRFKKNPYLCRLLFKNAYKNVAPSKYLFEICRQHGYYNVDFIPNSIQLASYNYKQRNQIKPRILWVRAFATIYNPQMAVFVFKIIKEKYPHASLTMVGPDKDGSLQHLKKQAQQQQLNINFTGKLSLLQWTAQAQHHDIFINTTHYDNTPISVLEAMALGLPVVSTNVGGIPYLLSHNTNALLVNNNDAHQMASAIESLLQNPILVQKISQNAKTLVNTMDWNQVKQHWNTLLS